MEGGGRWGRHAVGGFGHCGRHIAYCVDEMVLSLSSVPVVLLEKFNV